MSTQTINYRRIAQSVIADFSQINFAESNAFYWSASNSTVCYNPSLLDTLVGIYKLLHELGHALLEHRTFDSAPELMRIEVAAWTKARELAEEYQVSIDQDYIEQSLDSYRDWLHQRSLCPNCKMLSTESEASTYKCFNCGQKWLVSPDQRSRCYRQKL